MSAKDYLQQAFVLQSLIKAKQARIVQLQEMQGFVGIRQTGTKVQAGRRRDPLGDVSATLLDLISECRRDILRLLAVQRRIKSLIETLPAPEHRLILFERYVNLKRWEDIAADNGYSLRHLHRIHTASLTDLEDGIECHCLDMV